VTEKLSKKRQIETRFGRLEIALGVLVFVYATLTPMLGRIYPVLEPEVLFGFWPVLLMFLGLSLVAAGAGLVKERRWPYLFHVPLIGWIVAAWWLFH